MHSFSREAAPVVSCSLEELFYGGLIAYEETLSDFNEVFVISIFAQLSPS
jgi:hypothetical protein